MPRIFLSPSTQEFNLYLTEGSEEFWMNLIADAMEPYLLASGISFTRNDPDKPLSDAIAQSNAGSYDLHLALHSNASPERLNTKRNPGSSALTDAPSQVNPVSAVCRCSSAETLRADVTPAPTVAAQSAESTAAANVRLLFLLIALFMLPLLDPIKYYRGRE